MECGHVANAKDENGKPVCVICAGYNEGAYLIEKEAEGTEGLEDRKARCAYCRDVCESRWNLPFFEYRPDNEYDSYYCGCRGWD